MLFRSGDVTSSGWIIDTGCSYHMCPNREWFTTYKEVDGETINMGSDQSCKTVGIGSVRIKMHDGVVRTLVNVRHIPDLRKGLISLGMLESKGCKVVAIGGVLKVVHGSTVVMKGIRQRNLYPLLGKVVTSEKSWAE